MMLTGTISAAGRDPRSECETGVRDSDWMGTRMAYGYRYGVTQPAQKKNGFSFADFGKEVLEGAVTGGLASTAFYGAGKVVQALTGSIRSNIGSVENDLTIRSRNSGRGNPNAITHFDVELNTRQKNLLQQLPDYESSITINRGDVNLKDLAALTAKTGDEFAMFTRGSQRMIVRGNANAVNINGRMAQDLYNAGYKWSGHTHPGTGMNVKFASEGDMYILKQFHQMQSVIFDSQGNFNVFGG